ncbi:flavodoxin [Anaerovorax odorimutans]|uniref:Flavodoxin n=1 Tax=Anaerovorax odorimutans TaxID=109327 RepID=A0ABT1RMV7_9FIRM|nr:flavodoxin [Anaerovorax odorimutans]MCQ4636509.1 flavodoxin [Anaerovorax odorimutans]
MKKILLCLCTLLLIVSLAACGGGTDQGDTGSGSNQETAEKIEGSGGSVLIAYFTRAGNIEETGDVDATTSASINLRDGKYVGNTELLARWIQEEVGGELSLIQVAEPYSADYDQTVERGQQEKDENARPKLASKVENMESYDTVFLGFPNWWYDMPMAVYSFLEEYDLSGKTVIPFCTSGGSGFSDTLDTIEDLEPNIKLMKGLEIPGDDAPQSQDSVNEWLRELGFSK